LHDLNICHRDLKPENIVVDTDGQKLRLIDFGMSKILTDDCAKMKTSMGTPYYISPEVLSGKYDKSCDLWSMGVITFVLLCGEPPFCGENTTQLFKKIKETDYEFVQDIWKDISKNAKDFIEKLIEPNTSTRLSVEQALAHPWIDKKGSFNMAQESALVFSRLKTFKHPPKIVLELLSMLVNLLEEDRLAENKKAFEVIDADHSGTIS
jgi:calcium-dependent protein kinase